MKALCLIVIISFVSCHNQKHLEEIAELKTQLSAAKNDMQIGLVDETKYIHTVLIWLNEDVSANEKQAFVDEGLDNLVTCKSIYKAYYGPPAMTPRDIVDNSYSYAFVCHFKNKKDLDIYQSDPQHLSFIEKYNHLWRRVQIYDNLVKN